MKYMNIQLGGGGGVANSMQPLSALSGGGL